jgi:hypothetical protein
MGLLKGEKCLEKEKRKKKGINNYNIYNNYNYKMVLMNKMLFSNTTNYNAPQAQTLTQSSGARTYITPAALNAKMIDRVHKAKSGCSACGKRVM